LRFLQKITGGFPAQTTPKNLRTKTDGLLFFSGEEAPAKAGGPAKAGAVGADVKTGIMKWGCFFNIYI